MNISIIITQQDWATPYLEEIDGTAFHALYIADHPSFAVTESWTWLAYAAARTRRIQLGTHVTGAPFYHPTRLAKQVASVDALSNGRAVLGIGTAYEHQDFEPYGFPMPDFIGRVQYLDETIAILQQLFSGASEGFRGRFHHYEGRAEFAPRPVRGHVPIWIGLNKPGRVMDLAAKRAQAINTWQLSPTQVRALRDPLAAAVAAAGRRVGDVAITCDVVMARNANAASAERWRTGFAIWRAVGDAKTQSPIGVSVVCSMGMAMCEQAQRFVDVGCSELTIAVANIDDLRWLNERVASRLSQ